MALQSLLSINEKNRKRKTRETSNRKKHRAMKKRFRDNNNDRTHVYMAKLKRQSTMHIYIHTHNIR